MTKTSPTQRSLAFFREHGMTVGITEHWNPFARRRIDLFGFIDLVVLGPDYILACQTTSDSNVAARKAKILDEPRAKRWLQSGGRIVIHGWGKKGGRGEVKKWTLRAVPVTLEDFPPPL